ncbi:hypothetical protein EMIT0111MI5_80287 [Burkholderia sp. IT-111MI5]
MNPIFNLIYDNHFYNPVYSYSFHN